MGLLDRLSLAAEVMIGRGKGASSGPPGGYSLGSSWVSGPRSTDAWGAKRAPSPYELVEAFKSVAYSCVHINADAVSAVPLRLLINTSDGSRVKDLSEPGPIKKSQLRFYQELRYTDTSGARVDDIHEIRRHPLLTALAIPDDEGYFDLTKLIRIITMYADVVGSCYIWPEYQKPGFPPKYLWPLFSQYLLPIHKVGSAKIETYSYFAEQFKPEELLIFKHKLSLRDGYATGYSPLYAAIEYLRLEDKFVSVQEALLGMGPRPNLLASPRDSNMPIGEAERQRFEQDLNRKHARGMQGGVIVTNGSWDISPLSYSPTDLSGLKVAEYDLDRICACFDIPVALFSRETNLANFDASRENHAERGVRPRCVSIASTLTRFARIFDPRLFFAFDNCVKGDQEREARIIDMQVKNGTRTWNQANEDSEVPPSPYGDEPWIPSTLATPSMIAKLVEANIKASNAAAAGAAQGGGNSALKANDKKKPKGKSNGSSKGGSKSSGSGKSGSSGGAKRGANAAVHGSEGLTSEGEQRDPFEVSWAKWIVQSESRTQQRRSSSSS